MNLFVPEFNPLIDVINIAPMTTIKIVSPDRVFRSVRAERAIPAISPIFMKGLSSLYLFTKSVSFDSTHILRE